MAGSTVSNISIAVTANAAPAIAGLKVVQKELASVGKAANKSRNSVKAFGVELQGKGGANKKVRSVLQQTGYQFGDFAVQVGGGTSAMQAFGQQAPQLLQVFGPWGSIIGAGVAIFAAIAVAIQKTSAATKEAVPKAKTLSESMDALNSSSAALSETLDMSLNSSLATLREEYGRLDDTIIQLAESQRSVAIAKAIENAVVPLQKVTPLLAEQSAAMALLQEQTDSFERQLGTTSTPKLLEEARKTYDIRVAKLGELEDAYGPAILANLRFNNAINNNDFTAAADQLDEIRETLKAAGKLPAGAEEAINGLIEKYIEFGNKLGEVAKKRNHAMESTTEAFDWIVKATSAIESQLVHQKILNDLLETGVSHRVAVARLQEAAAQAAMAGMNPEQRAVHMSKQRLAAEKARTAELSKRNVLNFNKDGDKEELQGVAAAKNVAAALSATVKRIALEEVINGLMAKGLGIQDARTQATNDTLRAVVALGGTEAALATAQLELNNVLAAQAVGTMNKRIALEGAVNGYLEEGLGIEEARAKAVNDALVAAEALGGDAGATASQTIELNKALAAQKALVKAAKEHLALVKSFKEEMAAANATANTVGSDLAPLLRELAVLEALKSGVAQPGRAGVIADVRARIDALKKELGLAEKVKKLAEETRTFADTLKDAQNEALILGETLSIMKSEGVTSEIASEMAKAAIAFKTTKEQAAALQSVLSETAKTAAAIRLAAAPGLARQEFASGEAERGQSTNAAVKEFGLLMGGMGPDAAATLGALQAEWEAVGLSVTDVTANTEKFIKSTEKLSQAKLHIEMFKTLADTVNNSFATALDSIVTRTKSVKDAFSDMGRDILRTISRLLMSSAMQGFTKMLSGGKSGGGGGLFGLITGGLSSFLGGGGGGAANSFDDAFTSYTPSAKGNAFSGGSIIPFAKGGVFANDNIVPFANGGIVSRATMFPMNNGIGQMGEAGPEAIIPLSRGSDGKLGVSGGGTTVNQTINVTTGIQQTVRAEIQSLMPQIAAASTKAVLDARRRGGSFAGAFG
jgi:hypothetical protein